MSKNRTHEQKYLFLPLAEYFLVNRLWTLKKYNLRDETEVSDSHS